LHLRGYRERQTAAPLKENLAAAVLLACEWPEISAQGGALLDPFCGSGTLVLEAAMMSLDYAPGMLRNYWGFQKWLGHEEAVWNELMKEALDRKKRPQGASTRLKWIGSDEDYSSLKLAERGSEALGIRSLIHWERRELIKVEPPRTLGRADPRGLCVMNPPYGERIGVATQIPALYREIGDFLKKQLPGWRAGILTGSPEGMKSIGLKPTRRIPMWNGPIECRLLTYALF
jgi:23S rRNA (guanine2445-N2)-methyltransferase / 23S rRNA (guanine2069-N7)-methyltransferase